MKRDNSLDLAKGIAIFGVIVGHHVGVYGGPSLLVDFFWSFHMPLFFIISGYLFRQERFPTVVLKGFKGLILPYILTILAVDAWIILEGFYTNAVLPTRGTLKWIWYTILDVHDCSTMAMWFLPTLFFGKIEFFLINKLLTNRVLLAIAVLLMAGGAFAISTVINLSSCPFSLIHSLFVPFYLFVGQCVKRYCVLDRQYASVIIALIIVSLSYKFPVDLAKLYFPLHSINLITTVVITMSILLLCKCVDVFVLLKPLNLFCAGVQYMGKHSLFFLCIHSILWCGYQHYLLNFFSPFITGCMVCITIAIVCIAYGKLKDFAIGKYRYAGV